MTTVAPPPPAPASPPPLTPGNRTAVRVLLVIAATVLVIGCVVSLGVAAYGINSLRVSNERRDLPSDLRALTIDVGDATLRVRTDPEAIGPRLDLRRLASAGASPPDLEISVDVGGTRVLLPAASSSLMDWRPRMAEVTVTLPARLARELSLTTKQDDGALIVDAPLGRLTARTADGSVVLNAGARRIEVTARDGDVVSGNPIAVGESFVAASADGDIDVTFAAAAPRAVEATTRDGDISISLPSDGAYLVRTPSGDAASVRVPETTDPTEAVSEVTVRTHDGNVTVDTAERR